MKNKNIYTNNVVWQFFASIKLAVIILFFLAVTSIIGTLIPQKCIIYILLSKIWRDYL